MMNTYIHILRHVDFDFLLFSSFSENDTVRLDPHADTSVSTLSADW